VSKKDDVDASFAEILKGIGYVKTETDRGAALVGAAMLDEGLRTALGMYFEPDVAADLLDDGNAPLHAFSARIKIAYALSIIDREMYSDLGVIRSVRNEAAHFERRRGAGFDTGFDNTSVKDRLLNMKSVSTETRALAKSNPRWIYELFCITVSVRLHAAVRALHAGMEDMRFALDHARKGIRAALLTEKVRDGLTAAAAHVRREMEPHH
jgi:hypothetical protein